MAFADLESTPRVERLGDYWRLPASAQRYDTGRFAHPYGRLYRACEERAIRLALGGLARGSTVLDAACGTGRIAELLRHQGFKVIACDISRAMMNVARPRLASQGYTLPLVETTVEHLSYRSGSFDAVTCIGLLMHLDADIRRRTLGELARVSRGPVIVQYGCAGAFLRAHARMTGRMVGDVKFAVANGEMADDLACAGLRERGRFWALRPVSSSVILRLTA
jgi:SAM-dependent methyltransferase